MTGSVKRSTVVRRFVSDRNGNFGMMTAILLPVTLAVAGLAMDMTQVIQVRSALQDAADSAALSAASALANDDTMTDAEAIEQAKLFMAAQFFNTNGTSDTSETDAQLGQKQEPQNDLAEGAVASVQRTNGTGKGKTFDVTISGHYDVAMNAFTRLLGYDSMRVSVSSTSQSTTESKNALSMFLVLDRSGSMAEDTTTVNAAQPTETITYDCSTWREKKTCSYTQTNYYTKIEALKLAVADLTTQLDTADPDKMYVRTAAVSYNASMQTATSFEWGTAKALNYVKALTATGGTDSSGAMKEAYTKVTAASEVTAHKTKNGQSSPGKFIVFMTDGDNNYTSADTSTKATCNSAKAASVEIYTVAFMAPTRGKELLSSCATDTSHYYDANSAAELVAAFKEIGEKAAAATTRLTN